MNPCSVVAAAIMMIMPQRMHSTPMEICTIDNLKSKDITNFYLATTFTIVFD